jgi:nitrite reductase (cytochrome c-552)
MATIKELSERRPWINWVLFFGTVLIVFALGLFAASIVERRTEEQRYFQMVQPIPEFEPRNHVWGQRISPGNMNPTGRRLDTTFESRYTVR